jgi:hypothetical protein
MYKSMCAEKRHLHLRADPSRIYAIQGDTPQVDRLETPRTMFESCITYWSTSESIGRICTYLGRLGCKCLSSVLPPSLPHSSFANHSGFWDLIELTWQWCCRLRDLSGIFIFGQVVSFPFSNMQLQVLKWVTHCSHTGWSTFTYPLSLAHPFELIRHPLSRTTTISATNYKGIHTCPITRFGRREWRILWPGACCSTLSL